MVTGECILIKTEKREPVSHRSNSDDYYGRLTNESAGPGDSAERCFFFFSTAVHCAPPLFCPPSKILSPYGAIRHATLTLARRV